MRYSILKTKNFHIGRFHIIMHTMETEEGLKPYSYVKMKNGVAVLPIVNGKFALIKQFRIALDSWEWEVPAGMIDEEKENPEVAAKRELQEETGLKAVKMIPLGDFYPSGGSTTERVFLYAAECETGLSQQLDATEDIIVEYKTEEELLQMINNNEFKNGAGIAVFLKYYLQRQQNSYKEKENLI